MAPLADAFRRIDAHVAYLVIRTGFTGRLLDTTGEDVVKVFNQEAAGDASMVCVHDALRERRHEQLVWVAPPDDDTESALGRLLAGRDGYVVLRLCNHGSPWIALRHFRRLFGSDSDHEYCACLDGIPKSVSAHDHPLLDRVVLMEFA